MINNIPRKVLPPIVFLLVHSMSDDGDDMLFFSCNTILYQANIVLTAVCPLLAGWSQDGTLCMTGETGQPELRLSCQRGCSSLNQAVAGLHQHDAEALPCLTQPYSSKPSRGYGLWSIFQVVRDKWEYK